MKLLVVLAYLVALVATMTTGQHHPSGDKFKTEFGGKPWHAAFGYSTSFGHRHHQGGHHKRHDQMSTSSIKTFPTIRIANYSGPALVIVSCVTKDEPFKPHPHHIVGRSCDNGICTMFMNSSTMVQSFTNMGIQCVKRKKFGDSLKLRESLEIDPFKTGFTHKNRPSKIELNAIRLCFQVLIMDKESNEFLIPLTPVVTEPIFDKKNVPDLSIMKVSHSSGPASGGTEIIILCDKVIKDDLEVRFYQEQNGKTVWEGLGLFDCSDIHKQIALSLRTPPYHDSAIKQPVQILLQLRRPSDMHTSNSVKFKFNPVDDGGKFKRVKLN
ncbi:Embryonic polarity protein dorsal [Halotydeus destructor]|nr:Embryonic polarity protein dorsal [Halotydeus destructor]